MANGYCVLKLSKDLLEKAPSAAMIMVLMDAIVHALEEVLPEYF